MLVLVVIFRSLGSSVALADPSDQPGGTSGVLDTPELDALQTEAAEVQNTLHDRQAAVADVLTRLREAERVAVVSASARHEADEVLTARQDALAGYSAAIYVDGSAPDELRLMLDGQSTGDVVAALGNLDAVRSYHEGGLAAAARARADAAAAEQAANAAVDRVRAEAAVLQDEAARVEQAASDVTDQLTAALSRVNEQLAELQAAQVQVNAETAARWSTYLAQLAAAGVIPPPVATLMDPARSLPAGLVPIGASNGGANPGAAQLPRQPSSLLVLSDEAVRAVSAGLNALGLPYAPGTAAQCYDCGTLIQTAFGSVGITLPTKATELWTALPPVAPVDSLPGDLVFLGSPESGISQVGIALDPQTVLAADAQAGAVIIRRIPAEQVIGFARPVLPGGAPREVPAADPGALPMSCGATVYPASYGGDRARGRYPNGLIPANAPCPIGSGGHLLRCDASAAYVALSRAFEGQFGRALCITDSYRSFGSQVTLYGQKPALAAVPGDQQPRLCARGRPVRGSPDLRYGGIPLDAGQRRSVRLDPSDLGGPRQRPRGALALGVRRRLSPYRRTASSLTACSLEPDAVWDGTPRGLVAPTCRRFARRVRHTGAWWRYAGRGRRRRRNGVIRARCQTPVLASDPTDHPPVRGSERARRRPHMLIDCDTCQVRGPACADCVVTALIGAPVDLELPSVRPDVTAGSRRPDGSADRMTARAEPDRQPRVEADQHRPIELDDIERAAVRTLAAYGLVPPLRLVDSVTVSQAESAGRDRRAG